MNDITKIYQQQVLNEEVEVTITHPTGETESFKLEDSYGKVVARQLRVNQTSTVDTDIDSIFEQGDWTGPKQAGPKGKFKEIVINTSYDNGVSLIDHLANNKSSLLSLAELPVGKEFNFQSAIINKLPQELRDDNLGTFINEIHLNVIPKAATGVGLGESTFSIFGTAKKGVSGDLQWDGKEVEIKTNGPRNGSGAILGGDGYINKITDRLEAKSDYINLNVNTLNAYVKQLEDLMRVYQTDSKEQAQAKYEQFIDGADQLKNLFKNPGLDKLLTSITDVEQFMNTQLAKGSFKALGRSLPNPNPSDLLPNRLMFRINHGIKKSSGTGTNLPGQLASLLGSEATVEGYVEVFSEMKTYSDASDIKSNLTEFFNSYNYTDFNPKTNYENFQRLVGAIALICYQEKIGYDYITTGNDDKMTMIVFDMTTSSITNIYKQLEAVPQVTFDLNIDVYEGGSFKSQTVIAKSPRIKLA
jgi:outer membrane murein-binding lipoprotein Lpp